MVESAGERWWICSRRLAERRLQLRLTQEQLAVRLSRRGLPCTNRTVSRLENGQAVDADRLPALAAALECTVTYLVGLTDRPDEWEPHASAPASHSPERRGAAEPVDAHRVWILGPTDDEGSKGSGGWTGELR